MSIDSADFNCTQHVTARADSASLGSDRALPVSAVSSCCCCRAALDSHAAVYCATCMAPHHFECFRELGRCAAGSCAETKAVSLAAQETPVEPTPLEQAMAALRETQVQAMRNMKQTRMAFDVTKAAADSGSLNTSKFRKSS